MTLPLWLEVLRLLHEGGETLRSKEPPLVQYWPLIPLGRRAPLSLLPIRSRLRSVLSIPKVPRR